MPARLCLSALDANATVCQAEISSQLWFYRYKTKYNC